MTGRYEENLSDKEITNFTLWAKDNTDDFEKLYNREYSQKFYEDNYPKYLNFLKNNVLKKAS